MDKEHLENTDLSNTDLSNTDLSNNVSTQTLDDEFTRINKYANDMGFDTETLQRRNNERDAEIIPQDDPRLVRDGLEFLRKDT